VSASTRSPENWTPFRTWPSSSSGLSVRNPLCPERGRLIREGYHEELDRLIRATRDGKTWIADLPLRSRSEQAFQPQSGLQPSVRLLHRNLQSEPAPSPSDYIRRQTLANGERYVTEKLKEYEDLVLGPKKKRSPWSSRFLKA